MKFATKITLTFLALLAAALCAVGVAMIGHSFAANLAAARANALDQQRRTVYGVETAVFAAPEPENTAQGLYPNATLAAAAQQYAEQAAPGTPLALCVADGYTLYASLPAGLPRAEVFAAVAAPESARLCEAGGARYLLLATPLTVPGQDAALVGAYEVSWVFATRNAQLAVWAAATVAALALGAAAARWRANRLTAPLTRLQAASARIAGGDYAGRTGIKTDDEIGALSEGFDAMAAAVETRIDELHAAVRRERDFVAAFTHELKTPMTSMMGYASLLRAGPADPAATKEAADFIYHETRRLESLSGKLLALLGLESDDAVEPALVSDRALFAALARSLPPAEGVDLRFEPAGCTVCADRILWEDLLANLVRNACQACRGRAGGRVVVACQAEGGRAVFTVADNGCGIPAADLPRLTEPFYMVDKSRTRAGGGSGMGLALCAAIAARHGTALQFESEPGAGTTVTVALPLAPARPTKEEPQ